MINLFSRKKIPQPVLGYDIDQPRITGAGWLMIVIYLAVPAMAIGAGIDFIVQQITGQCVGIWCMF